MGRKPKFIKDANGDVSVRIKVRRPIWLICEDLASEFEIRPDKAFEMLLRRLAAIFVDNRHPPGIAALLGHDVVDSLVRVRRANFGSIDSGPAIDISKLHRSPKLKSGFVGVYPSGRHYRAEGRSIDGSPGRKHLGTFETAEEAAWARFMYYDEHDLPYGIWEEEIDAQREAGRTESDAVLIREFERTNNDVGLDVRNSAPGKPRNPSTRSYTGGALAPMPDDDDGFKSFEELQAENAARDEERRRRARGEA